MMICGISPIKMRFKMKLLDIRCLKIGYTSIMVMSIGGTYQIEQIANNLRQWVYDGIYIILYSHYL
jgi:hypothetical protein